MSKTCKVQWRLEPDGATKSWRCVAHLTPTIWFNEAITSCYYSNCSGRPDTGKPLTQEEIRVYHLTKSLEKEHLEKISNPSVEPISCCLSPICGKEIPKESKSTRYCSENCRKNYSRHKMKAIRAEKLLEEKKPMCLAVGCPNRVSDKKGGKGILDKKYCSENCRKRAYRQRQKGVVQSK